MIPNVPRNMDRLLVSSSVAWHTQRERERERERETREAFTYDVRRIVVSQQCIARKVRIDTLADRDVGEQHPLLDHHVTVLAFVRANADRILLLVERERKLWAIERHRSILVSLLAHALRKEIQPLDRFADALHQRDLVGRIVG